MVSQHCIPLAIPAKALHRLALCCYGAQLALVRQRKALLWLMQNAASYLHLLCCLGYLHKQWNVVLEERHGSSVWVRHQLDPQLKNSQMLDPGHCQRHRGLGAAMNNLMIVATPVCQSCPRPVHCLPYFAWRSSVLSPAPCRLEDRGLPYTYSFWQQLMQHFVWDWVFEGNSWLCRAHRA
jgi:hypothetical protein